MLLTERRDRRIEGRKQATLYAAYGERSRYSYRSFGNVELDQDPIVGDLQLGYSYLRFGW